MAESTMLLANKEAVMTMLDILNFVAFNPLQNNNSIAVLEAQIASDKLAHDREMKDVKEALRSIVSKLDSIELALRER